MSGFCPARVSILSPPCQSIVRLEICQSAFRRFKFINGLMKRNRRLTCCMLKKNFPIILVIVLALLLIVIVIWVFERRIENIDMKMR